MRALILSGGVAHPFEATSQALADLLAEVGIGSAITEAIEPALTRLPAESVDLVVLNALRWRMEQDRFSHLRDAYAMRLPVAARQGLRRYVVEGGALLGMHAASICFDDWPEWQQILGAAWRWDQSSHPPVGEAWVDVVAPESPIVKGMSGFEIIDEVYGFLSQEPDIQPLLTSRHGGRDHPLLWARTVGRGRVVYDALGHDERSFEHPTHREIVRRSARWLTNRPVHSMQEVR